LKAFLRILHLTCYPDDMWGACYLRIRG